MKLHPRLLSLLIAPCLPAIVTSCATAQTVTDTTLANVQLDTSRLRVHFIDIGPGLAVLIETPSGRHIFIDGGKWGLDGMRAYVHHFADPATTPIDIAIVTHADFDHFSGMRKIFEDYEVLQFWSTGYDSPQLSAAWRTFGEEVLQEQGCQVYSPLEDYNSPGDEQKLDDGGTPTDETDDVVLRFLNVDSTPPAVGPVFRRRFRESERRNNASFVFKITYGNTSFLFTGDINGRNKAHRDAASDMEIDSEELELWTRHKLNETLYGLSATVLQVSHHGSNGSSSLPFLNAVAPQWAVITAGHEHNHPHPSTLRRLSAVITNAQRILRTDQGDSTPEGAHRDQRGDDSFVFESDGQTITRVFRISQ